MTPPADLLRTTSASTLIPASTPWTWQSVERLVAEFWHTQRLLEQRPHLLMHSVAAAPGVAPDCWLTSTLETISAQATRVGLVHSEQADGAPPPKLDQLLLVLLARCIAVPQSA